MTNPSNDRTDERLRTVISEARENRAMQDRPITENRELTDEERIEMFRMSSFQHILPTIPDIPGFHTCWLSTSNKSDTIHRRERLGYQPVERKDIPAWDYDRLSMKSGEFSGLIAINEMVAYKISDRLYQAYMKESHYDAPLRQEEKLVSDLQSIAAEAKSGKSRLEMEGFLSADVGGDRRPKPQAF